VILVQDLVNDQFEARYATLGPNDTANLDEGPRRPTMFAPEALIEVEEAETKVLVNRAVS
jgi:hypothetical protein